MAPQLNKWLRAVLIFWALVGLFFLLSSGSKQKSVSFTKDATVVTVLSTTAVMRKETRAPAGSGGATPTPEVEEVIPGYP